MDAQRCRIVFGKTRPIKFGHQHVGKKEVDRSDMRFGDHHSVFAVFPDQISQRAISRDHFLLRFSAILARSGR